MVETVPPIYPAPPVTRTRIVCRFSFCRCLLRISARSSPSQAFRKRETNGRCRDGYLSKKNGRFTALAARGFAGFAPGSAVCHEMNPKCVNCLDDSVLQAQHGDLICKEAVCVSAG